MLYVNDLADAIENAVAGGNGLDHEQAYGIALHVLNFFGYADRIIDNVLEPEDRDTFYMLEDARILYTEREEITLYDGREWRTHYWLFDRKRIDKLRKAPADNGGREDDGVSIYDSLPADAWDRTPRE